MLARRQHLELSGTRDYDHKHMVSGALGCLEPVELEKRQGCKFVPLCRSERHLCSPSWQHNSVCMYIQGGKAPQCVMCGHRIPAGSRCSMGQEELGTGSHPAEAPAVNH